MAAITLKGIPEDLKERLEAIAERERRSLNQQAILLLERAVAEEPVGFKQAYSRFREEHGESPLKEGELEGLRSEEKGRSVDL
jgi:predicted transcriptional regulator